MNKSNSIRGMCPDIKPSPIFNKVPAVKKSSENETNAHPIFETPKKNLSVVEDLAPNKYGWNDMIVEVKELKMETSADDPKRFDYHQIILAEKENGDSIEVDVAAKSWFPHDNSHRKHDLGICGIRAEASWKVKAMIDGMNHEFEEHRKTSAHGGGTSAGYLLGGDKRINSEILRPLRENNIVSVKQIYRTFDKLHTELNQQ